MNRWGKINGGGQMLYVGVENFPFPVPLLQTSSGQWYFDTGGGADEILARRIGRNELVCHRSHRRPCQRAAGLLQDSSWRRGQAIRAAVCQR
jgi:hypothetical protein